MNKKYILLITIILSIKTNPYQKLNNIDINKLIQAIENEKTPNTEEDPLIPNKYKQMAKNIIIKQKEITLTQEIMMSDKNKYYQIFQETFLQLGKNLNKITNEYKEILIKANSLISSNQQYYTIVTPPANENNLLSFIEVQVPSINNAQYLYSNIFYNLLEIFLEFTSLTVYTIATKHKLKKPELIIPILRTIILNINYEDLVQSCNTLTIMNTINNRISCYQNLLTIMYPSKYYFHYEQRKYKILSNILNKNRALILKNNLNITIENLSNQCFVILDIGVAQYLSNTTILNNIINNIDPECDYTSKLSNNIFLTLN